MFTDDYFDKFVLPQDVSDALKKCRCIAYAETQDELDEMVYGPTHTARYDVVYQIGGRTVKEAEVIRCKNGAPGDAGLALHSAGHSAALPGG